MTIRLENNDTHILLASCSHLFLCQTSYPGLILCPLLAVHETAMCQRYSQTCTLLDSEDALKSLHIRRIDRSGDFDTEHPILSIWYLFINLYVVTPYCEMDLLLKFGSVDDRTV